MAEALGEPQIVVQLRDPVARAVSNWSFSRDHGVERRPLAEALRANLDGPVPWDPEASSVSPFAYLERGRYAGDVARWRERFPVHVQFLEEMLVEPARLGELFGWLGVARRRAARRGDEPVNASSAVPDGLDDELLARLRDYFAESDAALASCSAATFPGPTGWSHDHSSRHPVQPARGDRARARLHGARR